MGSWKFGTSKADSLCSLGSLCCADWAVSMRCCHQPHSVRSLQLAFLKGLKNVEIEVTPGRPCSDFIPFPWRLCSLLRYTPHTCRVLSCIKDSWPTLWLPEFGVCHSEEQQITAHPTEPPADLSLCLALLKRTKTHIRVTISTGKDFSLWISFTRDWRCSSI